MLQSEASMPNLPRTYPRIELGQLSYKHEHMKDWNGFLLEAGLALYINARAPNSPDHFLLSLSLLIFKYGLMPVMPTNPTVWNGMQR